MMKHMARKELQVTGTPGSGYTEETGAGRGKKEKSRPLRGRILMIWSGKCGMDAAIKPKSGFAATMILRPLSCVPISF
jgi:hypothetical protein